MTIDQVKQLDTIASKKNNTVQCEWKHSDVRAVRMSGRLCARETGSFNWTIWNDGNMASIIVTDNVRIDDHKITVQFTGKRITKSSKTKAFDTIMHIIENEADKKQETTP